MIRATIRLMGWFCSVTLTLFTFTWNYLWFVSDLVIVMNGTFWLVLQFHKIHILNYAIDWTNNCSVSVKNLASTYNQYVWAIAVSNQFNKPPRESSLKVPDYPRLSFVSLWPGDTIGWHISGSTLAQVMAWCHYLNQCWLIISEVLCHSPEGNFKWKDQDIHPWYRFENDQFNITTAYPRDQWVNTYPE